MNIPRHLIHSPEYINCSNLTKTKLPVGHARQERIEEIKQMAEEHAGVKGMFFYSSMRLNQLNSFSDEFYQQWVSDLKQITKKCQELDGKNTLPMEIHVQEFPKDIHGNKADLEIHFKSPGRELLEKQIQGLMNDPKFTLSEKDYLTFLGLVNGMFFKSNTSEMALAFITVGIMDKDELIVKRNNRVQDFKVLIQVIIYIYRHCFDSKSTLLLVLEGLHKYGEIAGRDFCDSIYKGETTFERVIALIHNPVDTER